MNILLAASEREKKFLNQISWIKESLHLCGYGCEMIPPQKILIQDDNYDLVIAFNKSALTNAQKWARKRKLPLIYTFTAESIDNCPQDLSVADNFIMSHTSQFRFPLSTIHCINRLRFYPAIMQKTTDIEMCASPYVLVAIDSILPESHTLLKLLPVFNSLTSTQFILTGVSKSLSTFCNHNIHIIEEASDILFHQTSFVIASGKYVCMAIAAHKPCIVVGDRGYGGILDTENFDVQFKHFFNGRIGAELDEYIPHEFIQNDITFLQRSTKKNLTFLQCNEIASKLKQKERETLDFLKKIIEKTFQFYQEFKDNPDNLCLKLSDSYIFQWENDRLTISHVFCRKILTILEPEETKIVASFNKPEHINDVFLRFKEEYDKDNFMAFITELVHEKILIVDPAND